MLFNSDIFILVFLPFWLIIMAAAPLKRRAVLTAIICIASLIFYSGDGLRNLPILVGSIVVNFILLRFMVLGERHKLGVILAVIFNLGFLAYFKYSCFFLDLLPFVPQSQSCTARLPLGISFFTFQQMALLIDVGRRRKAGTLEQKENYRFGDYFSFVSFFPQLIAGPIVREKDLLDPIREQKFKVSLKSVEIGGLVFLLGLFKKVFLADGAAAIATPLFKLAEKGPVDAATAWLGAYAFSFQIYFDFSGYSDMAVGLALMVGVTLPWNFNKPYRATSPIEFWRRWHITLSQFLRDYLYIPLGGSRKGKGRKYLNLFITMVLGGLWHGAAWTFIIWGAAHGVLLMIAHGLKSMKKNLNAVMSKAASLAGWFLTFQSVTIIWIFFRAESFTGAKNMFAGLINFEPSIKLMRPLVNYWKGAADYAAIAGVDTRMQLIVGKLAIAHLLLLFFIAVIWPRNTKTISAYETTTAQILWLKPIIWAILSGVLSYALYLASSGAEPFIYFNF